MGSDLNANTLFVAQHFGIKRFVPVNSTFSCRMPEPGLATAGVETAGAVRLEKAHFFGLAGAVCTRL